MGDGGGGSDDAERNQPESLDDIPLSLDAMLDVLSSSPRRYLLESLRTRSHGTASFEDAT